MIISSAFITPMGSSLLPFILVIVLFVFTWIWVAFSELRTKAITITIDGDRLTIRNFLGMGAARSYSLKDFDGFKYSILASRQGDYEYLYLMKNNRKLVKISQFYHRNYQELKQFIAAETKDLGFQKFSYVEEFKEIFT